MKITQLFKENENGINAGAEAATELLGENLKAFEKLMNDNALGVVTYKRFQQVNDEKIAAKSLADSYKTQIDEIGESVYTQKSFDEKVLEIKGEYEGKLATVTAQLNDYQKDTYIKDSLRDAKAKHIDLLINQVNKENITNKDGKWDGMTKEIEALKTTYADLFGGDNQNQNNNQNYNPNYKNDGLGPQNTNVGENLFAKVMGIDLNQKPN